MRLRPVAFLLLLAFPLSGRSEDLGHVGLAVLENDATKLQSTLRSALIDRSSLVRATAARVANVRRVAPLLDDLRNALAEESDLRAAREEARALVMLGGAAEIDAALTASTRFDHRLDGAICIAVARLGYVAAIDEWFKRLHSLSRVSDGSNFFRIALWGAPAYKSVVASRLLGANDERGFLLMSEAAALDPSLAVAAMTSQSPRVREKGAWALVLAGQVPDVAQPFIENPPDSPPEVAFAVELLRRMKMLQPRDMTSAIETVKPYLYDEAVAKLLTESERKAARLPKVSHETKSAEPIAPPPFTAGSALPDGVGAAIVSATHCRGGWFGIADVGLDGAGRVTAVDTSRITGNADCRKALQALIALSLPENHDLASPRTGQRIFAFAGSPAPCTDEGEPPRRDRFGPRFIDAAIKPPVVRKRVEPQCPLHTPNGVHTVVVESLITRAGCVADVALVNQSAVGPFNTSALIAVSQWTFSPATLDGEPVDVMFDLTVTFRK